VYLCIVIGSPTQDHSTTTAKFEEFILTYTKSYSTAEEKNYRLSVFQSNLEIAQKLDEADPYADYGVTKFMDLTPEEFKSQYLISNFTSRKRNSIAAGKSVPLMEVNLPSIEPREVFAGIPYYDWRDKGVVTAVYNQGSCGSCWAFSTTEQIESMWAIAGHGLVNLAMQQLVDCDTVSHGCSGGNPPDAFQYVINQGGIDSLGAYPYVGLNEACHFNPGAVAAKVKTWGYLSTNDNEAAMLSWTGSYGPPSVCVDAVMWQYYTGGVITTGCGNQLDHCVQITGWNIVNGIDAWTVRNSWGTNWGISGYLYVGYGANVCGIGQECQACLTD
jgi:cysteine peptidase B